MAKKSISDKQMMEIIKVAIDKYRGQLSICESAIGALIIGRHFGWHVLRVLHSSTTLNKYSKILGVELKEILPERTEEATKVTGIVMADKFDKFWKAVGAGIFSEPGAREVGA